jgi:hypothetical protein
MFAGERRRGKPPRTIGRRVSFVCGRGANFVDGEESEFLCAEFHSVEKRDANDT